MSGRLARGVRLAHGGSLSRLTRAIVIAALSSGCGSICCEQLGMNHGCKPPGCDQDFQSIDCRESVFAAEACLVQQQLKYTPTIPAGGEYPPGTMVQMNNAGQLIITAFKDQCFGEIQTQQVSDPIDWSWEFKGDAGTSLDLELGQYFTSLLGSTPKLSVNRQLVTAVTASMKGISREQTSIASLQAARASPAFPAICGNLADNQYTVIESAKLGAVELSFADVSGQKIDLTNVNIKDLLSFDAGTHASIDLKGTITFQEPAFVGFRLVRLNQPPVACCDESGVAMCSTAATENTTCAACTCARSDLLGKVLLGERRGVTCFP